MREYPWHCEVHSAKGPSVFVKDCGCYERMMKWLSDHLSNLKNCPKCGDAVEDEWKDLVENILDKYDLWHIGTDTFIGCYDCASSLAQEGEA